MSSAGANAPVGGGNLRDALALAAVLVIGGALRTALLLDVDLVYRSDMEYFVGWTRGLLQHGLAGFHDAESFCDYPPLALLLFLGVGRVAVALFGPAFTDAQLQILLKTPAVLADLAIGVLLYAATRRIVGRGAACGAASLYVLNPAALYDSAYWGQIDSAPALLALAALMLAQRQACIAGGAFAAAAVLLKFQSIVFVPILLLEAQRTRRWRAPAWLGVGAVLGAGVVLAPFAASGALTETLSRAYVEVVGQYPTMSKGALNVWEMARLSDQADDAPPIFLLNALAVGRDEVQVGGHWVELATWRHLSLALFALATAGVLALYSLRPSGASYYGAAGLLGLAFYLFPTEMHERYAIPALAVLPVWAVGGAARERCYWLVSMIVLLGMAAQLSVRPIGPVLAAGCLLAFFAALALLPRRASQQAAPVELSAPAAMGWEFRALRWGTSLALLAATGAAGFVANASLSAATPSDADEVHLGGFVPVEVRQEFRTPLADRAVSGGPIRLTDTVYLRGLGVHAPSRVVYEIPAGWTTFRAMVGLDHGARGRGTAVARIELDGREVFRSERMSGATPPQDVAIPVQGARRMALIVEPTGDGRRFDHVSWALARFTREAAATQPED